MVEQALQNRKQRSFLCEVLDEGGFASICNSYIRFTPINTFTLVNIKCFQAFIAYIHTVFKQSKEANW